MSIDAPLEPTSMTINVPGELGEMELVCAFVGYSKGSSIDATSSEPKLQIGVLRESKYEALKLTDHPGETYYFVALRRVRPSFDEFMEGFGDE